MARKEHELYFPQLRHNTPLEHATSNAQYTLESLEMNWRYQPLFYFDDVSLFGHKCKYYKEQLRRR